MSDLIKNQRRSTLYDRDYYLWLRETVRQLQAGDLSQLDLKNLIEEIDSLGKREKRAIESNLIIVILHLLKWYYQPQKRSSSWRSSIREHRRRVERLLTDSPSLKNYLLEILEDCYLAAKKQVSDETGLSVDAFPPECPFTLTQTLDENFI